MWVATINNLLLQWNTRSLITHRKEFEQFRASRREKPTIPCIHEPWLKPYLDFVLCGYLAVRQGRRDGGGCVTFVRQGIPYRVLDIGNKQEYVVLEVLGERKKLQQHVKGWTG